MIMIVVAVVIMLAFVLLGALVGYRALQAKASMEQAQTQLSAFRAAVGDGDQDLPALYRPLQQSTARAVQQTRGPAWWLLEQVWWIGPNLTAFRVTVEAVDGLVQNGIGPVATAADGLSVDSLTPRDGRIDLAPLARLAPAMGEVDDAVQTAQTAMAGIDTTRVVPQLRGPIGELRGQLEELAPVTGQARTVLPLLAPMLGSDDSRHYLLMFQNNAEERASGGNPASLALLTVEDGAISLGRQASSSDFPHPYEEPPFTPSGPGDEDWGSIYTDYTSTYLTNITMTPDFPSTAAMARAMWEREFGGTVDGVISFDPVALAYLLKVTGPVELTDGSTVDAGNAVSFLLYDVYAKYPAAAQQDEVFASAARSIFAAIMSGKGEPGAYLAQLRPAVAEQRLKVWSARSEEQAVIERTPVATMLPGDNRRATVLGVYNNDDATSKMSYFTDQSVAVTASTCEATPTYKVATTVTNTLREDQVDTLPDYVRAHQRRIPAGGDRQWVQLYGPVGATLESVTIDGEPVVWGTNLRSARNTNPKATGMDVKRPAVQGSMYGRPVGVVSITLGPSESSTVTAVFSGGVDPSDTVTVSHTPKVRQTPVEVRTSTC